MFAVVDWQAFAGAPTRPVSPRALSYRVRRVRATRPAHNGGPEVVIFGRSCSFVDVAAAVSPDTLGRA